MPSTDPHEVLGVALGASAQARRRAFRRRALELHPDVAGAGPDAEDRFAQVVAAYRALERPPAEASRHAGAPKVYAYRRPSTGRQVRNGVAHLGRRAGRGLVRAAARARRRITDRSPYARVQPGAGEASVGESRGGHTS